MSIFSSLKHLAQTSIDTILITPRRLRSIDQQLKVITQMKDGVFSFFYKDINVKLALPDVCRDAIQTSILDQGTFWEINNLERVAKYIKPGAIIADCGSNIGNHSVFFAKICQAQTVYAFEPQRHCFNTIVQQAKINNVERVINPLNVALGDVAGTMTISKFAHENLGGTEFTYSDTNNKNAISAITLDSLNLQKLDFMKIDVEGAQLSLLRGARETLIRCAPTIWIEMLGSEAQDLNRERKLPQDLLHELGYSLVENLTDTDFVYCRA